MIFLESAYVKKNGVTDETDECVFMITSNRPNYVLVFNKRMGEYIIVHQRNIDATFNGLKRIEYLEDYVLSLVSTTQKHTNL